MPQQNKASSLYKPYQWIIIILSVFMMFAPKFIPAPAGLTQSGFHLLGIICAAILLWVGIDTTWPNLLVMLALMTVPELGFNTVAQKSFGNDTVVFLIFCMMLAAVITKTGIAKRLAIYFLTTVYQEKVPGGP